MNIAYIGVPVGLGADRKGVEIAPDVFRQNGVIDMLNHIAGCYDLGNINSTTLGIGTFYMIIILCAIFILLGILLLWLNKRAHKK